MRRRARRKHLSRVSAWFECRGLLVALAMTALVGTHARAQIVVHDAAVTARNAATAIAQEFLLQVQDEQHRKLRRMAQRLSLHTDLRKYVLQEPPRWRTHDFESFLYANPYHAALNYGDATGAAYQAVTLPVVASATLLGRLAPTARPWFTSRLATVDLTDALTISSTHASGLLRYTARRELQAIDALERHVIDPSNEQSATAVLDKISGASLIGARQRQARLQFLTGVLEQLLVDSKRARDTEAAMLGMQLTTWREGRAANEAFMSGTGQALRTWRQP
jgi:hypothetical protein